MTKTKQQQQQQQNVKKNTFGAIHSILSKVGIKKKTKGQHTIISHGRQL